MEPGVGLIYWHVKLPWSSCTASLLTIVCSCDILVSLMLNSAHSKPKTLAVLTLKIETGPRVLELVETKGMAKGKSAAKFRW